jgi:hypothetical protein
MPTKEDIDAANAQERESLLDEIKDRDDQIKELLEAHQIDKDVIEEYQRRAEEACKTLKPDECT